MSRCRGGPCPLLARGRAIEGRVAVRVGNGEPQPIANRGDITRWSAALSGLADRRGPSWWRRPILTGTEPDRPVDTGTVAVPRRARRRS